MDSFRLPGFVPALGLMLSLSLFGCAASNSNNKDLAEAPTLNVVATTNMVADLVAAIGGEHVIVTSLMGPGVDPHLYKASEGDVARMVSADVVFYAGLHLEGKMVDIFEQMSKRGKPTFAVTDGINRTDLIESKSFGGNYDPHVWFDVDLWRQAAKFVTTSLMELNPVNKEAYELRGATYALTLQDTDAWVENKVGTLPVEQRVLITSHDAFGYFGKAYNFEVHGLQGISTATEAGTADVQQLAELVASRKIPAMFVETSVPARGIEAVRAAVRSKGVDVVIGGHLYSDALGDKETPQGEYNGMIRYNVSTIVDALSVDKLASVDN